MKVIGEKAGKTILVDSNCRDGGANIPCFPRSSLLPRLFVTRDRQLIPSVTSLSRNIPRKATKPWTWPGHRRIVGCSLRESRDEIIIQVARFESFPGYLLCRYARRRCIVFAPDYTYVCNYCVCTYVYNYYVYTYKSSPREGIPSRATRNSACVLFSFVAKINNDVPGLR